MFFVGDFFSDDDETMGGSLKLKDIFSGSLGIGSQLISGFGKNRTQQIGYSPGNQSIFAVQTDSRNYDDRPIPLPYPNQYGPGTGQGSGIAEDFFGSITGIISRNPLPIAAGIFGLYLLMREPPRRR